MAKLEQSKAVVSAAEEAQADLEAAERFKADLQPGLESFKDRILALEAQLPGDQPTEALRAISRHVGAGGWGRGRGQTWGGSATGRFARQAEVRGAEDGQDEGWALRGSHDGHFCFQRFCVALNGICMGSLTVGVLCDGCVCE